MAETQRLRIVTYNIHRARGLDRAERLDRVIAVLREVDADIVALQEVMAHHVQDLAAATGMQAVFGPTRLTFQGAFGNLCLTRIPVVAHRSYNLTCRPFESRGCVRVDVRHGSVPIHVFNVHLGLRYRERVRQVRMLTGFAHRRHCDGLRVVLGDFNEWFHGHASRMLRTEFGRPCGRRRGGRTHPSPMPVFALDRIYHDAAARLERVAVHRSRTARVASDHLPTYADLRLFA